MTAYAPDLAFIHDVGFGYHARLAAPGLLAQLHRYRIDDGLVVDLGCGSGIWAAALVEAGYDVLGIDQSAAMLALARKAAPGARFRRASFFDTDLPPCAAITSLGECLGYLFDKRSNLANLKRLFRKAHAALRPGGVMIFDLAAPGRKSTRRHFDRDDWALMFDHVEDTKRGILTRTITSFVRRGRLFHRDREVHRLRLYRRTDVLEALRAVGFRARTIKGYGDMPWPAGLTAYVARKPG